MMEPSTNHDSSSPLGTLQPAAIPDKFDEKVSLKFYETIPTLQEMASYALAIELRRQFISNLNPERTTYWDDSEELRILSIEEEGEVAVMLLEISLPRSIRDLVDRYLRVVRYEMIEWARFYWNIFCGDITMSDLMLCHWQPNGKIDHRKSALNMLSNSRLTLVDKFKIACEYCLEDEIKKIPIDSLPENFIKSLRFFRGSLKFYWLCYLNNDLDKIPIENGQSVASMMISSADSREYSWLAYEYFWDRLSVDEQISKFEEKTYRAEFQKKLFFKMSESQIMHILSKIPITIMDFFWNNDGQERFALQTWIYIKDFVDYEQFEQMWNMLNRGYYPSSNMEMDEKNEKIRCVLEIWNHCPDRLKKLAFTPYMVETILGDLRQSNLDHHPCGDIEFLIAYLSYASAEFRKSIIFERANVLVSSIDLSSTDRIVKLCLPDSEDVVEFKKYVLESDFIRSHLSDIIHQTGSYFENVNPFWDYFCPDPKTRSEFCCKIVEAYIGENSPYWYEEDNWIKAFDFIDKNSLLLTPDRALKFKKRIILSGKSFYLKLFDGVEEVTKLIEQLPHVLDAEELDEFKTKALQQIAFYEWDNFDENAINIFMSWCCNNDDEKLAKFKETLSMDDIFEKYWNRIKLYDFLQHDVDQEEVYDVFERLDKRLQWYFGNDEEVMWFKLRKVFAYRDGGGSLFLLDNGESNVAFIKNTLPWFFGGNRSAIDVFKGINRKESISKLI